MIEKRGVELGGPKCPHPVRGKIPREHPLQPDIPSELSRELSRKFPEYQEIRLFGDGWSSLETSDMCQPFQK